MIVNNLCLIVDNCTEFQYCSVSSNIMSVVGRPQMLQDQGSVESQNKLVKHVIILMSTVIAEHIVGENSTSLNEVLRRIIQGSWF